MTEARDFKSVDQTMPHPFEHMSLNVCPVSIFGKPGVTGHSVGVMNEEYGQGHRYSLEYAEAHAKAVLRAIRAYRRKNRALLTDHTDGSR